MSKRDDQAPIATIAMAMYNEEKYLSEAIASVQKQTEENWELLIVDDHSTDRSFSIAEEAAKSEPRIVVLKNPGKGKVSAFNTGVTRARGQYVHLFAGDDVLLPECIEKCLKRIHETGTHAVYHELQRVDENLKPLPDQKRGGLLAEHTFDEALLKHSYAVPSGLWFFDKTRNQKAWPIPKKIPYEDAWLGVSFRAEGPIGYLPDQVYLYRQHDQQTYGRAADRSLKTYRFRMERLGRAFEGMLEEEYLRAKMSPEVEQFCRSQKTFADLLCGKSRSPFKLMRADLAPKRKLSIMTAWYCPWLWSALRRRTLRVTQ